MAQIIDNELPVSMNNPLSYVRRNTHSMFMETVSVNEIGETFLSLKNTKSDIDALPVSVLKRNQSILSYPFSLVVNQSFSQGVFPYLFKRTTIVPIFKRGDKLDINNYQPISTLSIFSKVIEKCMARRIVAFAKRFGIF